MRVAGRPRRARVLALWSEGLLFEASWLNTGWFTASLLLVAAAIDFVVGDPWGWPHPVQWMGKAIELYCKRIIAWSLPPLGMRLAGIGLTVIVVGGTAALSIVGLTLLAQVGIWLQWGIETILLASCFAGRSLRRAAEEVQDAMGPSDDSGDDLTDDLTSANLTLARERLAVYVGRDTHQLEAAEIRRAVLETVSENGVDGVLAPLFYAIVGALLGWAAPVALAYKAVSTLDSMVGYKEAPYTDLGWFSAKFEDILTWLPCRLSVLTIAMLSGTPGEVLRLCWRDARTDPSPNAGWSECAYAAALGVQLGGENTYRGIVKVKPPLGNALRPITNQVIVSALGLTRQCFLIGLVCGVGGCLLVNRTF